MAGTFSSNLAEARLLVHRANVHLSVSSHELAFPLYLQAAELYSLVLRQAQENAQDKKKLRTEWADVLATADRVKKVLRSAHGDGAVRAGKGKARCDRDSQALTLLQSSAISTPTHKLNLPQWTDPSPSDFASTSTHSDPHQPPLPASFSATYARPPPLPPSTPIWPANLLAGSVEQDVVADCSFVAGVQAALAWSAQPSATSSSLPRPFLLSSTLFPQDPHSHLPIASSNGLHHLRLFINGAWRRLPIDNTLPVSASGEPIGIRINDCDTASGLGPKLLEKGWLKVMGGWDFPGSNSSIDLHALTGWIPETVGIKSPEFQREKTWTRLHEAFLSGTVLVTIGTGRLSPEDMALTGLIPRHDYAVQEMVETSDGVRSLRIRNPWRRAQREAQDCLKGTDDVSGEGSGLDGGSWTKELRDSLQGVGEDGSFTLSWEMVCATFDALYLNWDPRSFKHSQSVHSSWGTGSATNSSDSHPQIILHPTSFTSDIWLLLSRHLTLTGARPTEEAEYISLQTFEDGSGRSSAGGRGTAFTDSPHTLVRVRPTSSTDPITLVLSRSGPPTIEPSRFSLFGYSNAPFSFADPPPSLPYRVSIKSDFLGRSAGGSPAHPTFLNNPSYRLEIKPLPSPASDGRRAIAIGSGRPAVGAVVKVCVETGQGTVPVRAMLLWGKGERVESVVRSDILADSGLYTDGIAIAGHHNVAPGIYSLVLSSNLPKQETPFTLSVESTLPLDLKPIPLEGAGMFLRVIKGVWSRTTSFGSPTFGSYHRNPTYRITLEKGCTVMFRLSPLSSASPSSLALPPSPLPMNLTVFFPTSSPSISTSSSTSTSTNPHLHVLGAEALTTGPYSDAICGVVTPRRRLEAGEYLVVVSTYGPWSGGGGGGGGGSGSGEGGGVGVGYEVKGWSEGGKIGGWEKVGGS